MSGLGHRRILGEFKETDFLVQNMRHEVLLSSRHRTRTMLTKAKHLTPTPSNAARRCAQRARQFVWQCRSHSEADDPPGCSIFRSIFDFVGHIEFSPPSSPPPPATTLLQLRSQHWLFFFLKKKRGPRRSRTSQRKRDMCQRMNLRNLCKESPTVKVLEEGKLEVRSQGSAVKIHATITGPTSGAEGLPTGTRQTPCTKH